MKLLEKLKNRYNILILILGTMMFALGLKLAILTIAQGDHYRDKSDNKRIRKVSMTAPRGEIRDKNGVLLAGNYPSFTVQVLKDEIKRLDDEAKANNILLHLFRLLEEDGSIYENEFPIEFNTFKYSNGEVYDSEGVTAGDKVIDEIVENNLLGSLLKNYYVSPEYEEHFKYLMANKVLNGIRRKGIEVPVVTKLQNGSVLIEFEEGQNIDAWKKSQSINPNASAEQTIIDLVNNDKNIIRELVDHGVSRKLIYDNLKSRNLLQGIEMEDISLKYDREYKKQKVKLMREFDFIKENSKAKEDFINLVMHTSIKDLLNYCKEDKKGNIVAPGEILIEMIEKKDLKTPVQIEVNKKTKKVKYFYKKGFENDKKKPIDELLDFAVKNKIIGDFITSEEVKGYSQSVLLNNGYNPRISISNWEYIEMVNKKDLYKRYKLNIKKDDVEDLFDKLVEKYKIKNNLSKYEKLGIINIYDQLDRQGHRAYEPVNLAYGINNFTVAKIEEGFMDIPAVQVSIEPIRYYPNGEHAAHILGYLGKISSEKEIQKYIEEKEYSQNDIIGKTGVEESFEDKLRGKNGFKNVEVDVLGNTTKTFKETKSVPGNNVYLTIDSKVQKVAEDALKQTLEKLRVGGSFQSKWGNYQFSSNRQSGGTYRNATSASVVAIDVKKGELVALANYPAYNPNLFSTGITSTDWNSLFPEDERDLLAPRPLYNIAMQTAVQPGSTFKPITGLTALEKGFSATRPIYDGGYVNIGDTKFRCLVWTSRGGSHGSVNLYDALKVSCNYYFYSLAMGMNQRTGEGLGTKITIDDIVETSTKLGLNEKSGIEINTPNETVAGVPDPSRKILITQSLMKRFLSGNIEKYTSDGKKLEIKEKDKIIKEIISWTESDQVLSRNEIIRRLDKLGIDGERINPGEKESLGDTLKYTYLNHAGWTIADTLNVTIGQGQNAYTPLQMANALSIMVNGGYKHDLTLVNKITNYDNSKVLSENKSKPKRIDLNNYENLEHVKEGMRRVATGGTSARLFSGFPVAVGAKTGTAQNSGTNPVTGQKYDDYSWFIAYGPHEDPEIAVAVVIFQGGSGGNAGPIAREVMAEFFGLNNNEKDNLDKDRDNKDINKPQ